MKTRLFKNPPPPYFIVLASSVKTQDVEVIEFHKIVSLTRYHTPLMSSFADELVTDRNHRGVWIHRTPPEIKMNYGDFGPRSFHYLLISSFIYSFIESFIHSFILSIIYLFIHLFMQLFMLSVSDDFGPRLFRTGDFGRQSVISDGDLGRCALKSDGYFVRCAVNSDAAVNSDGDFGRCAVNSDAQFSSVLYHYLGTNIANFGWYFRMMFSNGDFRRCDT